PAGCGDRLVHLTSFVQGAARVFSVKLSDFGSGSYTFTLYDNLDHGGDGTTLPLNFSFTAKDSDGDTTLPSTFTVNVTDTIPTAGSAAVATVSETTLFST